jgi:hypothetical protein
VKTIMTVVLTFLGTALLLAHSAGHAAGYSSPVGRYSIVHGSGAYTYLLDTQTGAVWDFTGGTYCQDKTDPSRIRQVESFGSCNPNEDSISTDQFERISVGGLYTTPLQKFLDSGALKTLFGRPAKPKQ